jgi:hypothetical protein
MCRIRHWIQRKCISVRLFYDLNYNLYDVIQMCGISSDTEERKLGVSLFLDLNYNVYNCVGSHQTLKRDNIICVPCVYVGNVQYCTLSSREASL